MDLIYYQIHAFRKSGYHWDKVKQLCKEMYYPFTDDHRKVYNQLLKMGLFEEGTALWLLPEKSKPKHRIFGIIPDVHAPFNHPNFLTFCKDIFIERKVTDIIFIGDLVDNHAISRHDSSTRAKGPVEEYNDAKGEVALWVKTFPVARFVLGNHDAIPERQLATIGIPPQFLKSYEDLWGLPDTWEIAEEFDINDVLYFHGISSMGKDGILNTAIASRMSAVQGHTHTLLGCKYSANKKNIIFGLNVGCGIDVEAYSMEYAKHFVKKPTLGCGVVVSSSEAYAIPMTNKYFRSNE